MIVGTLLILVLVIAISLSVFGGGQVFMPMFNWLWKLSNELFKTNISDNIINKVFTISNATPGVVSTKFAFFTGFIYFNYEGAQFNWWGILFMLITYLVFCLPAILIMILAMKYLNKVKNNSYIKKALILIKPVVAGIMITIGVQLLLNIWLPFITFNEIGTYFGINWNKNKLTFFKNWRLIALLIYVPINIIINLILYKKLKIGLFYLMLGSIISSLLVFEPWLN